MSPIEGKLSCKTYSDTYLQIGHRFVRFKRGAQVGEWCVDARFPPNFIALAAGTGLTAGASSSIMTFTVVSRFGILLGGCHEYFAERERDVQLRLNRERM